MNIVDHPSLGVDTRNRIPGGAVDRHSVIERRAADPSSFSHFGETVNVQRSGTKVIHIREHGNIHVGGDDTVVVDDLGYGYDRLVGQTKHSLINDATADKRPFEPVKFNQTCRKDIISAGAY